MRSSTGMSTCDTSYGLNLPSMIRSYELHTAVSARRQGIGRQFLEWMKMFGTKYKMKKIMLTCHKGTNLLRPH
jgi:hypothetical protein